MASPTLVLDPEGVVALLMKAFPGAPAGTFPSVVELAPGRLAAQASVTYAIPS